MFNLEINENDKKWLLKKYPELTVNRESGIQVVSGEFHFYKIYQGKVIADTYDVKIEMRGSNHSDLPKVFETASRIKKIAEAKKIPLADLHIYEDGSVCLCVKLAETDYFPDGFSFQKFIEELVVPFFYAESYFEKFDNWPWDTYSHGILGWLEWYFEKQDTTPEITREFLKNLKSTHDWNRILSDLTKDHGIKGHQLCICGSKESYRKCHGKVFQGLWKLSHDIKKFRIQI